MTNPFKKIIKKTLVLFFAFLLEINSKMLKASENYTLCFDCLYDKNQEQIDTFTFFEYLKKQGINAKYIILKGSELKSQKYLDDVIFVKNKWEFIFKHLFLIINSKFILTSFGLFDGLDEIFKNCPLFEYIFMEHGVIYCPSLAIEIYSKEKFNKVLTPTKVTYDLYKKENLWQENEMILAGLPRWDKLKSNKNNEIFIFFSWQKSIISSLNSASNFLDNIKNLLDELSEKIPQDVKISFAWHHEFYRRKVDLPKLNKRINLIKSNDISGVINSAPLLITDCSSIFWDFFYQNKPVIFYKFNQNETMMFEQYRYFDCCTDSTCLLNKINEYISVDFELSNESRVALAKLFYESEDSNCFNIQNQIFNDFK